MSTICRTSDSVIAGAEATDFIQCVDVREPHIYELWCMGLDRISRKVHPTTRADVTAGPIGYFVND